MTESRSAGGPSAGADPQSAGRGATLVRGLQLAILACLAAGVLDGNVPVIVNAALGLAATEAPAIVERDAGLVVGPRLTAAIAVAVLLHTLGMLGLYGSTGWWDHLTHTLSASLVALAGFAGVRAFDEHADGLRFPPPFLVAFVFLFTLAIGVAWEVLEFGGRLAAAAVGVEPVLRQFGVADTMLDLLFDALGAVLAAAYGGRQAGALGDRFEAVLERRRTRPGSGGPER